MSEKTEIARNAMIGGFNCAQSVFSAFAPDIGFSKLDALRVGGAFGGGMGLMGNVCGAVTGAFMAIGLHHAKTSETENEEKAKAYRLVQLFTERFRELHGSIGCRELIGIDLSTEAGMKKAMSEGIFANQCLRYVEDATQILEELLSDAE